jgi:hypothetical protein|tara:strand:- start:368 stop:541 length:174 start_codon:yes stop_codon:yes gene_type:complete
MPLVWKQEVVKIVNFIFSVQFRRRELVFGHRALLHGPKSGSFGARRKIEQSRSSTFE